MRTRDVLRRAGRNLRQAKGRTILTSLAIGVGAFTIALAMAAGNGGRAYTEEMVSTSGDAYSLTVYPKQPEVTNDKEAALPEYGAVKDDTAAKQAYMTDSDAKKLLGMNGVESVNLSIGVEPLYVTRGEAQKKRIAEVTVKDDRTEVKLAAGALKDNMPAAGEVIIPEGYLSPLGFADAKSAIGQRIFIAAAPLGMEDDASKVKEFPLTVAAVSRKSDTSLYFQEAIAIPSSDAKLMAAYRNGEDAKQEYYSATVLLKNTADVKSVQQELQTHGYDSYGLADTREALLQMVNIAQWGLAGFGALAILASIFGIINTQYISVLERTQQIGLMKALGARSRDISKLFRYEAAWIGFLGGAVGVVLAFAVTFANPIIASTLQLEDGTRLLRMDWISSIVLIGVLMVVAVVSGLFPSRKAAKLDPIEALRTE